MRCGRRFKAALTWYAHDAGKCRAEPARNSNARALALEALPGGATQTRKIASVGRSIVAALANSCAHVILNASSAVDHTSKRRGRGEFLHGSSDSTSVSVCAIYCIFGLLLLYGATMRTNKPSISKAKMAALRRHCDAII